MPNLGTLAHEEEEEGNDAQEPIQLRLERMVQ
jgi:hypothetical protein